MALASGADAKRDSRGVAAADLDRDGRVDLVIASNNAPPTILMNYLTSAGSWVQLELVGSRSNRDAVGAAVRLTAGGTTMIRAVEAGAGYSAQSAHSLHFGLGDAQELESLEVRWPSGEVVELSGEELRQRVPINGRTRLIEGQESARVVEGESLDLLEPPGAIRSSRPGSLTEAP